MPKINLSGLRKYAAMIILVVLMALFAFSSPYFLTLRNLTNIVTQNTYFIIVAIGLSFVMIGGGIDLSVGCCRRRSDTVRTWSCNLQALVTDSTLRQAESVTPLSHDLSAAARARALGAAARGVPAPCPLLPPLRPTVWHLPGLRPWPRLLFPDVSARRAARLGVRSPPEASTDPEGRLDHRDHQRAYRARQRRVMDQGSLPAPREARLARRAPVVLPAPVPLRCIVCGRAGAERRGAGRRVRGRK